MHERMNEWMNERMNEWINKLNVWMNNECPPETMKSDLKMNGKVLLARQNFF